MAPLNTVLAMLRGKGENENSTHESSKTLDKITFKVNEEEHTVGCEITSDVMLVDYIRNNLELRGTKYMCREAGCGACIVNVVTNPGSTSYAVNSCLVPIMSCHGWEITTIEKIGNRKDDYHALQKTLAEKNGTQCGHCTPGWIMAMYSLLKTKPDITMSEIEKSLCSNICRCTGYRPILEAFKRFASDAKDPIVDIEDLHICEKTGKSCARGGCLDKDWCIVADGEENINIKLTLKDGKRWYVVHRISDVFKLMLLEKHCGYKIVSGNTARAAYPFNDYPEAVIDISRVSDLKGYILDQNLIVGAGITITEFMDIIEKVAEKKYFEYLKKLYKHILLVAHVPVRNAGSLAGNLMIKHTNNEFQSDLFLIFQTVGAQLTIRCVTHETQIVTMEQFLKLNMEEKLIINIMFPPLSNAYMIKFYKIMSRIQAVHAIVNAGFLFKTSGSDHKVEESRIAYGALSTYFTRAYKTEHYLIGKPLFTNDTLQGALAMLDTELVVEENPPEPCAELRKGLAMRLFYKGLLYLCPTPSIIHPRYLSGATDLHEIRPVSKASQSYDTDPSRYPIGQPIPKVEALIQCSGEAQYTEDLPKFPSEVFAAFVLATTATGDIVSIDPTKALNYPGVIAFYTAKDIPGLNSFTPSDALLFQADEEVLCDGSVKFYNQPIGIIVAETRQIADRASLMVDVTYKNIKTPVVDVLDAKKDSSRCTLYLSADPTEQGTDITKVIKGNMTLYGQYHFTMETLVCVTKPTDNGLEVHASTQWMSGVQVMVSRALLIDESCIDVRVSRVGGSYGFKVSRSSQVAVACSLVAKKLNRPCRFIQALSTNMKAMGKRLPCSSDYEVAVSQKGVIQYANMEFYEDNGYKVNENFYGLAYDSINNCYPSTKVGYKCYNVITDTPKNTWCRSPGTLEFIANAEFMMERISYELGLDPLQVRLNNIDTANYGDLVELINTLKTTANYESRRKEVNAYNIANRWKKRGLRFSCLRWTPVAGGTISANVTVFRSDGSVSITHGGIEMGQGVNTKAIQICSKLLGVPMDSIKVMGNDSHVTANCFPSGGSLTSENIGIAVTTGCEELISRLATTKESMTNPTWKELIAKAFSNNVNLQTQSCFDANNHESYNVYGACLAEVEIDVLTGESEILRLDLMEDAGASVNPEIDIGQVEGAAVMGIGYWTSEHLAYDSTGELLTTRAWNYHVPQARDIPQVMNIHLKKKSYGTTSTYGSKCVGEPPICLMQVIPLAIREALVSARSESGHSASEWFDIGASHLIGTNFIIELAELQISDGERRLMDMEVFYGMNKDKRADDPSDVGPHTTEAIGLAACTTTAELKLY